MSGLNTVDRYWSVGINDFSLSSGILVNPDYTPDNGQSKIFLGDVDWSYSKDSIDIKNWTWIQSFLLLNGELLTRELKPVTGEDTYILKRKANDVKRVARWLDSFVETKTSSTVITIPQNIADSIGKYDARFLTNNLGGRLRALVTTKTDGIEHDIAFNISGNIITFDEIITNLAVNDRFELINAYDIIKEATEPTSLPVRGYVIKHVIPSDAASIKFAPLDKPNFNSQAKKEWIIIYYNELEDNQPEYVDQNSVARYGLFYSSQDLTSLVLTLEQFALITNEYHKFIKPLETFTLTTYRPTLPERGWKIPISVTGVCSGLFTILDVSWEWVHPYGEDGEAFRKITVTLASYVNKLGQILAGFARKSELAKAILNQKIIHKSFSSRKHIFEYSQVAKLLAPTALSATSVTSSGFTANYSPDTTKIYIYSGGFLELGYPQFVSGTSYASIGLNPSTAYTYKVSKHSSISGLESALSNEISVTTTSSVNYALRLQLNENTGIPADTSGNSNSVSLIGSPTWISDSYGVGLSMTFGTSQAIKVLDSTTYEFSNHHTGFMEFRKNNTGTVRPYAKDNVEDQFRTAFSDSSIVFIFAIAPNFPNNNPHFFVTVSNVTWVTGRVYKMAWCLDLDSDTFVILIKDTVTGIISTIPYTIQIYGGYNYYDVASLPAIHNSTSDLYIGNDSVSNQPVGIIYEYSLFSTELSETVLRSLL